VPRSVSTSEGNPGCICLITAAAPCIHTSNCNAADKLLVASCQFYQYKSLHSCSAFTSVLDVLRWPVWLSSRMFDNFRTLCTISWYATLSYVITTHLYQLAVNSMWEICFGHRNRNTALKFWRHQVSNVIAITHQLTPWTASEWLLRSLLYITAIRSALSREQLRLIHTHHAVPMPR
jgi:hypothetical protein